MSDLISRQAAIDGIADIFEEWKALDIEEVTYALQEVSERLQNLPTIDPVKHGEWKPVIDGHDIMFECSECQCISDAWTDYCPICGSRNIEETDEDEEAYEEALEKFKKNPKTYTLDEIEAELLMDGGEDEADRC